MAQQSTNTEQKADTGPLSLPPELSAQLNKPRTPLWIWAVAALGVALIVAAVVFFALPADPMSDTRPVEVAQGFVAAIEAKDASKMLSFVVPTELKREIGAEVRAYIEYIDTISFSDVSYTLLDNDGQTAHVRWVATMHYKLNFGDELKEGTSAVDTVFEMTKIEGAWYLQNAQVPST
jgi:uncharacterized membrane protein YvbJ